MLQPVQMKRGRCRETLCYRRSKGKIVVRKRRDVTDSAKWKAVIRDRRFVKESARGKRVGR